MPTDCRPFSGLRGQQHQSSTESMVPVSDSCVVVLLLVFLSLGAGRVFRFAFDDEIFTLRLSTAPRTLSEFLHFATTYSDVHPRLSYFFYSALNMAGFNAASQRAVSLLITACAAGIIHRTAVQKLGLDSAGRIVGILLFS